MSLTDWIKGRLESFRPSEVGTDEEGSLVDALLNAGLDAAPSVIDAIRSKGPAAVAAVVNARDGASMDALLDVILRSRPAAQPTPPPPAQPEAGGSTGTTLLIVGGAGFVLWHLFGGKKGSK